MPHLGTPEVIVILLIVLVLFGVGRISKLGSEFGSAISNFRKEAKVENDKNTTAEE